MRYLPDHGCMPSHHQATSAIWSSVQSSLTAITGHWASSADRHLNGSSSLKPAGWATKAHRTFRLLERLHYSVRKVSLTCHSSLSRTVFQLSDLNTYLDRASHWGREPTLFRARNGIFNKKKQTSHRQGHPLHYHFPTHSHVDCTKIECRGA